MLRKLLATTALSIGLASAAAAQGTLQEQAGPDAAAAPEAPIVPGQEAAQPTAEAGEPTALEDEAPAALAEDPMVEEESPVADEPTIEERPQLAEEEPGRPALDLAGATPEDLVGSDVRNLDDERLARVEDVVTNPEGEVETIIVRFGGFLGLGQSAAALLPDEVEVMREEDDVILRTALTADELRDRPAHEN